MIWFPNYQTRQFTYDLQGRLTVVDNSNPNIGTLARFEYQYDVDWAADTTGNTKTMKGQRSSVKVAQPSFGMNLSNSHTKYHYDANYQLVGTVGHSSLGGGSSWSYDAIGNRLTATTGSSTSNYTYFKNGSNPNNGQRLASVDATGYQYDPKGNTTSIGTGSHVWNPEDQLTSMPGWEGFVYDYQGRRVKADPVWGTARNYFYNGLDLVTESYSESGLYYWADYLFAPGIDEPLARWGAIDGTSGAISYYSVGGLGSVALLSGADGSEHTSYAYDPWGNIKQTYAAATLQPENPFRYTAREWVADGMYYYRARYYTSATGRFASEDPMRFVDSSNAYIYAINNPVYYTDPSVVLQK